jgi:hypothetical protein
MTPPKVIRVLGREVEVRFRQKKDMPEALGEWHAEGTHIDLRRGQKPIEEADSLLHEIAHATLAMQGREFGGDTEELYVRALATGLLTVLRENPSLVAYLMQEPP